MITSTKSPFAAVTAIGTPLGASHATGGHGGKVVVGGMVVDVIVVVLVTKDVVVEASAAPGPGVHFADTRYGYERGEEN